ncbi:hypothetical protein H6501_02770 [Candidatus Woesearchaeota archaeon]|nr:hypothetical protein [Candidatus Woesearchaeota archaeon]
MEILSNPLKNIPSLDEALEMTKKYGISLHPAYLFYWNELSIADFISLLESFEKDLAGVFEEGMFSTLILPNSECKRFLELLGVEHHVQKKSFVEVKAEKELLSLVLEKDAALSLLVQLGAYSERKNEASLKRALQKSCFALLNLCKEHLSSMPCEILSSFLPFTIRDKGGSYIGARMGRPEKAKMRKLDGRPHGLFTVGEEGGRMRNIMEAYEKHGKVESQFALYWCEKSQKETIYRISPFTNERTEDMYFERYTGVASKKGKENAVRYKKINLEIREYVEDVRRRLKMVELPKLVKGIRGTSNKHHLVEHMTKAFLRAKNNVYVNKDGTVRYDMIEMGLTHFKPKEIGTSLSRLKELGYTHDYLGNELVDEDQILEIFPQDVILPDCVESGDELASDYVLNTGKFMDELLVKLYGLEPFYNFKTKEDTVGHLLIGLAPHTSAGIVGRILGYSKTQGCFSHPVWHAAQRRNLDGDENGVMLLLDGLINFSREYLPDRRGAKTMDTSLVLTSHLYLDQIDDEVHGMDIVPHYTLELYRAAKEYASPKSIKVEKVEKRIDREEMDDKYLGYRFTHSTDNMNNTVMCSSYKSVPSMKEKMDLQLELGKKIRAVDADQVGTFIIDKHFMKDIKGNLRKFGMQSFRCTACNTIHRRPPLNGKCINCSKPAIVFTIAEGSVKKYLEPSFRIVKEYNVDPYIVETLELANLRVEGVFGKETEKQKGLKDFFGG